MKIGGDQLDSIQKEFRTYSNTLMKMGESDFIIGFKDGEAEIIKNRWGPTRQVKPQEAVQYLIKVLKPFSGIGLFDVAAEQELVTSILSVLDKHRVEIEPVITGEQKL